MIGATNEDFGDVDEDASQEGSEEQESTPKGNCYQVAGTLQNPKQKPDWVKEFYDVSWSFLTIILKS